MTIKNKIHAMRFLFFSFLIFVNKFNAQDIDREPILGYIFPTIMYPTIPTIGHGQTSLNAQSVTSNDATDVRVFPSANLQAKVHISIDKTNPNNIITSANTYVSPWAQQGYYTSFNAGLNWSAGSDSYPGAALFGGGIPSVYGDPSTAYDANGNVFISTLDLQYEGSHIIQSIDKGVTWATPVSICQKTFVSSCGAAPVNNNIDKEMIAADDVPNSPYVNNIYATWTEFDSDINCNGTSGFIGFNRSINGGATFSTPIQLRNDLGFGQGANVQTGPNGEVYVCWADYGFPAISPASSVGFAYSADGGVTFTSTNSAFAYIGIRDPAYGSDPYFNNTSVNDFPTMAVDKSCGPYSGRIYIAYPEQDQTLLQSVIQVKYSDDNGLTWNGPPTPVGISGINVSQSFFPWIAVDDKTGIVSIAYYAFDNLTPGLETNTYVAYSTDGGMTFNNIMVSDVPHHTAPIPGYVSYAGDYIGITAYGGKAYAAWADDMNGTWQIYVSEIQYSGTIPFYTTTPNILNVNGPIVITSTSPIIYQAVQKVIVPADNSTFQTSNNTDVSIRACEVVNLRDGFSASYNFHAFIDCGVPKCINSGGTGTENSKLSASNSKGNPSTQQNINSDFSETKLGTDIKAGIFPNPSTGLVYLNISAQNSGNIITTVTDVDGRLVFNSNNRAEVGANSFKLDLSSLQNGVYSIRITDNANNIIKRDKIILTK